MSLAWHSTRSSCEAAVHTLQIAQAGDLIGAASLAPKFVPVVNAVPTAIIPKPFQHSLRPLLDITKQRVKAKASRAVPRAAWPTTRPNTHPRACVACTCYHESKQRVKAKASRALPRAAWPTPRPYTHPRAWVACTCYQESKQRVKAKASRAVPRAAWPTPVERRPQTQRLGTKAKSKSGAPT